MDVPDSGRERGSERMGGVWRAPQEGHGPIFWNWRLRCHCHASSLDRARLSVA